jgi:hypothetical protein
MGFLADLKALFTSAPTYAQKVQYLDNKASTVGGKLNWRDSVVDFLKLMGMDSSVSARATLAKELGYAGEYTGTSEQNEWLKQNLMDHLVRN